MDQEDERDIDEDEDDDWVDEDEENSVHATEASSAALGRVLPAIGKVFSKTFFSLSSTNKITLSFVKLFGLFVSALSVGKPGYKRLLGGYSSWQMGSSEQH